MALFFILLLLLVFIAGIELGARIEENFNSLSQEERNAIDHMKELSSIANTHLLIKDGYIYQYTVHRIKD